MMLGDLSTSIYDKLQQIRTKNPKNLIFSRKNNVIIQEKKWTSFRVTK